MASFRNAERFIRVFIFIAVGAVVFIGLVSLYRSLGPSDATKCEIALCRIVKAQMMYANDHDDLFSNSFDNLSRYMDSNNSESFTCPASGVEYRLMPGCSWDMPPDTTMIVYCPAGHPGFDTQKTELFTVGFANSSVERATKSELKELISKTKEPARTRAEREVGNKELKRAKRCQALDIGVEGT